MPYYILTFNGQKWKTPARVIRLIGNIVFSVFMKISMHTVTIPESPGIKMLFC